MSSPAPPSKVSFPPNPLKESLPPKPQMTSALEVPFSFSLLFVPTIVQVLPLKAFGFALAWALGANASVKHVAVKIAVILTCFKNFVRLVDYS